MHTQFQEVSGKAGMWVSEQRAGRESPRETESVGGEGWQRDEGDPQQFHELGGLTSKLHMHRSPLK